MRTQFRDNWGAGRSGGIASEKGCRRRDQALRRRPSDYGRSVQGDVMPRRSRGTGGLFVRTDSAGRESWYGQWRVGGRRVKRRLGTRRQTGSRQGLTRSQAERKLQELIAKTRSEPTDTDYTVGEIGRLLLSHLATLGRKPSTLGDYESYLRVHIAPFFGDRRAAQVGPKEVESFIVAKRAEGKATKSVLNYLGFLHSIFAFAERRGFAAANPVRQVDKPRAVNTDPDVRFLDDAELERLVGAVPDDLRGSIERPLYMTAGMSGLRQGELIALRWRDVDFAASRIRVRRNFVRGQFGAPKSRRSTRSVPMAGRVAQELGLLLERTAHSDDDDLVFAHPLTGGPLDRSRLLKRFKAAARRAGIDEVRFHDLRHTFGTRMAAAGVPLRTLQEWMGHRDFKTTLIYADYQPSEHEAELVDRAFGQ